MDIETARLLCENLIDRLVLDPATGQYRLDGAVTIKEHEALRVVLLSPEDRSKIVPLPRVLTEESRPSKSTETTDSSIAAPVVRTELSINKACLSIKPERDVVGCVDFGTAYSKAAFWRAGASSPIPLDLSQAATGTSGFILDSSIYISGDLLHFGANALDANRRENDLDRERFDSPKEWLSSGHLEDIEREHLTVAIDPSRKFSPGDLLRLYLAYLTCMMGNRLNAQGISPYLPKRFAVPVWRGHQLETGSALLRTMLVDAQLISDSIDPSAWHNGFNIELASGVLRAIKNIPEAEKIAAPFIDRRVTEATAAASGISDHISNQRPRVVVVDIGAGTCDFGAYQFVLPRDEQPRVAPFIGTERAIKQAGNRLDDFLVTDIIRASGTDPNSDSGRRISKHVRRDIRPLKQTLFADGQVRVQVPDYLDITISRDDFVESPHVVRFVETFRTTFIETVLAAAGNFFESGVKKYVVFTGGGAGLPMIRDLFDAPLQTPSGSVYFQRLDPTPTWVSGFSADVRDLFPQLAVSTGGCSPDLPEERSGIRDAMIAPRRIIQPILKG
ncbi:MAG: hypothetical protein WBB34_02605 [Xanthobacteraceae bacterium]